MMREVTFVIEAGAEFKLVAQNPLDETCWASPAISDAALFLASRHLFCIKP